MMDPIKRLFTVWRFTSPTTGHAVIVAKPTEPGEAAYEHQYQRILARTEAYSPAQAVSHYPDRTDWAEDEERRARMTPAWLDD